MTQSCSIEYLGLILFVPDRRVIAQKNLETDQVIKIVYNANKGDETAFLIETYNYTVCFIIQQFDRKSLF